MLTGVSLPPYMFSPKSCGGNDVSCQNSSAEGFPLCWLHFYLEKLIEQIVLPQEQRRLGGQNAKHASFQQDSCSLSKTLCAGRARESENSRCVGGSEGLRASEWRELGVRARWTLCNFLLHFLDYNHKISPFPFLPPSCPIYPSLFSFKFMALLFTNFYCRVYP